MARLFDDANTEYLEIDSALATAEPFTMAAWIYSDTIGLSQGVMFLGDKDVADNYHSLRLKGAAGGDPVGALSYDGVTSWADTTTGYSADTWHHVAGVWTSASSRAAFIDGGSKGTNAVARAVAGEDRTSIGRSGDSTPAHYMSGRIAEAVFLNIAATDYQVWLHAQGVPAPVVWPGWAIVAYYPLFEVDRDFPLGRYNMTPFNTPFWAPHPPKVLAWYRKYMRGGTA